LEEGSINKDDLAKIANLPKEELDKLASLAEKGIILDTLDIQDNIINILESPEGQFLFDFFTEGKKHATHSEIKDLFNEAELEQARFYLDLLPRIIAKGKQLFNGSYDLSPGWSYENIYDNLKLCFSKPDSGALSASQPLSNFQLGHIIIANSFLSDHIEKWSIPKVWQAIVEIIDENPNNKIIDKTGQLNQYFYKSLFLKTQQGHYGENRYWEYLPNETIAQMDNDAAAFFAIYKKLKEKVDIFMYHPSSADIAAAILRDLGVVSPKNGVDYQAISKFFKIATDNEGNLRLIVKKRLWELAENDGSVLQYVALNLLSNETIENMPEDYAPKPLWEFINKQKKRGGSALEIAERLFAFKDKLIATTAQETKERVGIFVNLVDQIANSPSREIKKIQVQVLEQLVKSDSLEGAAQHFKEIENIFVKNNLPFFLKAYQVFAILYPEKNSSIDKLLDEHSSPILASQGKEARRLTIFRDLLKINIESGNQSLRQYLTILQEEGKVLEEFETTRQLTPENKEKIADFLNKMDAFYQASFLREWERAAIFKKSSNQTNGQVSEKEINNRISLLRKQLYVDWAGGQALSNGFSKMFLEPLGYSSFEEALSAMKRARQEADRRGREYYQNAKRHQGKPYLQFETGDLHKGFNPDYLEFDLQYGVTAPEYLGAESGHDLTPLDTDFSFVYREDIVGREPKEKFQSVLERVIQGYGDLKIIVRNRDQLLDSRRYLETDKNDIPPEKLKLTPEELKKYEIFPIGGRHFGIRTGISGTEIDFLVATDSLLTPEHQPNRQLESIFFAIARNGHYIPVANSQGEIIFSPKQFDELRKSMRGLEFLGGEQLEVDNGGSQNHQQNIANLAPFLQTSQKETSQTAEEIKRRIIKKIVAIEVGGSDIKTKQKLFMRDNKTTGILGVELFDTGSTGRLTNVPGEADFDLLIALDEPDFSAINTYELTKGILDQFEVIKKGKLYQRNDGSYQLHGSLIKIGEEEKELDLGFTRKDKIDILFTHQAIAERLEHIKRTQGEGTYQAVIANIVLAKKILKKAQCYKKGVSADIAEGGLGGVGVENWILANNGSFYQAALSFLKAAFKDNNWQGDNLKTFEEFKKGYNVWDPGVNLLGGSHDEFVSGNMTAEGYQKMLAVLKDYLEGNIVINKQGDIVRR
jgi:hypothetical protein